MYFPVLSLKLDGAISVKLKSSAAKQKGRRPVKLNRKKAGSLRAIKGKGHLIHPGKKVFHGSSIMLWTARVQCSAIFAEGMIVQVHFRLETQTAGNDKGKQREVKTEPVRETDMGYTYKVVFRASKFQKSLAWWLLIQLIRCRTIL